MWDTSVTNGLVGARLLSWYNKSCSHDCMAEEHYVIVVCWALQTRQTLTVCLYMNNNHSAR